MLTITAIRPHVYAGKPRRVGDVYMAPEKDARLMLMMHNARMSAVAVEDVPTTTRVEIVETPKRGPGRPKGSKTYKRRDMQAEK